MLGDRLSPYVHGRVRGEPSSPPGGLAIGWTTLTYGGVGTSAALVALAAGHDPVTMHAWLPVEGATASALSVVLGIGVAAVTVAATRAMVARIAWARQLHRDLRPAVHGANDAAIFVSAFASGVAEELLFRGLLVPIVGALFSSVAFGLLHQVRGRARWAWAGWAGIMGVFFAGIFECSGRLEGAIVAHVLINTANLRFLRDGVPSGKATSALGGLLGSRDR